MLQQQLPYSFPLLCDGTDTHAGITWNAERWVSSREGIYWEKGSGMMLQLAQHRQQHIVALIGAAIRTNSPHFRPVFCPRFQQDCFHFLSTASTVPLKISVQIWLRRVVVVVVVLRGMQR